MPLALNEPAGPAKPKSTVARASGGKLGAKSGGFYGWCGWFCFFMVGFVACGLGGVGFVLSLGCCWGNQQLGLALCCTGGGWTMLDWGLKYIIKRL